MSECFVRYVSPLYTGVQRLEKVKVQNKHMKQTFENQKKCNQLFEEQESKVFSCERKRVASI